MSPDPSHPSWTAAGEDEGPATPQELARELGTASTLVPAESLASAATMSAGDRRGGDEPMPTRVGRYVILGPIGKGGMGVVYAAYDPELDRRVAIKLLLTGEGGSLGARLLREAQALARLSHPNVVQVHDAGAFDGRLFMAMEMVEGETLRAWLAAGERPWRSILQMFIHAGRGLVAAHAVGIVHRDFKPDNVLVGRDGRVRVADFGLARQGESDSDEGTSSVTALTSQGIFEHSLTATGAILGTPAYMAPEQIAGRRADARSDTFSFSVALFESLYRRRPFEGASLGALAMRMAAETIVDPPAHSRVPARIYGLLRRGLAYDPADRYPSLEILLSELSIDPERRRRGLFLGVGLAAALAGGSFAAARVLGGAEAPCSGAEEAIVAIWGEPARAEVEAGLDAAGVTPTLRERARVDLDAYAERWAEGHQGACMAHQRGEDSATLRDARMHCLDRRRDALAGAVNLFRAARPGDDVARVLAGLPSIDACARRDALADELAPLEDPARAREVAEVERQILEASVLADAGRAVEATEAATAAVEAAAASHYPPIHARALLARARVLTTRFDFPAAADDLRSALAEALRGEDASAAAESASRLVYARAIADAPIQEVLADVPIAAALIARLPAPDLQERRLRFNEGTAYLVEGDRERARERMREAVDGLAGVIGADPIESAIWLSGLAKIEDTPERHRDLFAQAEALLSGVLGDDHLEVLSLWRYRGRSAPDLVEGRVDLEAACAGYRRLYPEQIDECAECHILLGHTFELLGEEKLAEDALDEVAGCLHRPDEDTPELTWFHIRRELAATALAGLRGEYEDALTAGERLLTLTEPSATSWWIELHRAEIWLRQAKALRALGRAAEALPAAERADEAFARLDGKVFDTVQHFQGAEAAILVAELVAAAGDDLADADAIRPGARAGARRAQAFYERQGERWRPRVAAIDRVLADLGEGDG